jgi:hypothetical protein
MRFILAVGLCVLFSATAAAQVRTEEGKQRIRKILEAEFSAKTAKYLRDLRDDTKRNGATKAEQIMAADAWKRMLYQEAYGQYRCVTTSSSFAEAEECMKRAGADLVILYRLITQHGPLVADRSARCEMQSRLFDAEIEFPPFSFLKGATKLYDLARMFECLRK